MGDKEALDCLKKWYDDAEDDFLSELYSYVRPHLREMNKAAIDNIFQTATLSNKKDHKALEQEFNVLYQNLQLFQKSAEQIEGMSHRSLLSSSLSLSLVWLLCLSKSKRNEVFMEVCATLYLSILFNFNYQMKL